MRLHERLKVGKDTNCAVMARELEVSAKTIMRDIEFMRDRLGLPIEYDSREYSYRYTSEVESFPTVQVSEGEVVSLLVAQKALEQYRGTPFEKTLESAFRKIVAGLRDEVTYQPEASGTGISFHNIGVSISDLKTFENLSRGIRDRRCVSFDYRKLDAPKPESRLVHPHHLACVQGLWYLVAFDPSREGLRTFALPRISGLGLLRAGFKRRPDFKPDTYFKNSFGVFAGEGTYQVLVRFDGVATRLVQERFWHASQTLAEQADGTLELGLKVSDLNEVFNWLLGWGSRAKVLAPESLVRRMAEECQRMAGVYGVPKD